MAFDVDAFLDDAQDYSDQVKRVADDAIERLEGIASLPFIHWVGFADKTVVETDKPAPIVNSEDLPVLEKSDFDWSSDFFDANRFQMPEIDSDWFTNLKTTLDTEIANGDPKNIAIQDRLYSLIDSDDSWLSTNVRQAVNTAIQSLVAKLSSDISTGGTGISQEVQDALFNEFYERDLQREKDEMTLAASNLGARGFPMPNDMLVDAQDRVMERYGDNKSQRSRDILVLVSERAQQNVQFASSALIQLAELDQGTFFKSLDAFTELGNQNRQRLIDLIKAGNDMEQAKIDYSLGYARVFHDLSNALLEKFRTEQAARIAEFDGQMKTILAKLEVAKINADLQQADNELTVKKWEIDARDSTERTKALIQQAAEATQVKLSAATSLSTFYSALVSSALGQVNAIVENT